MWATSSQKAVMTQEPAENQASTPPSSVPVNPLSLTVDEAARMLSVGGGRKVTAQMVQADIDAGAPTASGGRINLVHYTAWLIREVQAN